jgi:hypothetical protein
MKEFNFETLLETLYKYFYIFIILLVLSIIAAFFYLKNENYSYLSKKTFFSNDYENTPIIANLNKKLTKMDNIQNLINDQFVNLSRLSNSNSLREKDDSDFNLPTFMSKKDVAFFNNDFILDQYYKVLTTNNLVSKINDILKSESNIPHEIIKSFNSLNVSSKIYFNEGLQFSLQLSHDKYIDSNYTRVFYDTLFYHVNSTVKKKLLDIFTLYQLNYNQAVSDSIELLESYLVDFDLLQEKLNLKLLDLIKSEIEYAKISNQEWPLEGVNLQDSPYSYVQGYRILEKKYENILNNKSYNNVFLTYEFVLKSLNNMVEQINVKYENLEDILKYNKEIKFMELRSDEAYNVTLKRDPKTVYMVFIFLSQFIAFFISLFLFSFNRKR